MSTIKKAIKRTDAVNLINRFRQELGEIKDAMANAESRDERDKTVETGLANLENALKNYGLEPAEKCTGEAHSNANIDHCGVCLHGAFTWKWCGDKFKIT